MYREKEDSPCKKRLLNLKIIFMVLFSFGLSLTTMLLSMDTRNKTEDKINRLQLILQDMDNYYIKRFFTSTYPYYSEDDEQKEMRPKSVFNVIWEGISSGCQCGDQMESGECSDDDQQCKTIYSYDAQRLQVISPGTFVNGDLETSAKLYEFISQQDGKCDDDNDRFALTKLCGNKKIPETVICIDKRMDCPVYSIQFSTPIKPELAEPNWGNLKINSNLYLYYDQKGADATTLPISQIVTTAGNGPCWDNSQQQTKSDDKEDYFLFNWRREICEKDPTFIDTGFSITEKEMYRINLATETYKGMLNWPGFNLDQSKEVYRIYYRNFMPWKLESRSSLPTFVQAVRDMDQLSGKVKLSVILAIVNFTLMGCIVGLMSLFDLIHSDMGCRFGCALWKAAFSIGFSFASLIQTALTFDDARVQYNLFNSLIGDNNPTDGAYRDKLSDIFDFVKNDVVTTSITLIISIYTSCTSVSEACDKFNKSFVRPIIINRNR